MTRTRRIFAGIIAFIAIATGAMSFASPASAATIPQGASTTVLCPDGSGSCTEYRYGFSVPGSSPGQFGIYYTVKWSASKASFKITRVRLVNNSSARIYISDLGFEYQGHYYRLRLEYGGSVGVGYPVSYTDSPLGGGLSGNGVGKYLTTGSGTYATANPSDPSGWYSTLGSSGITGAFYLN